MADQNSTTEDKQQLLRELESSELIPDSTCSYTIARYAACLADILGATDLNGLRDDSPSILILLQYYLTERLEKLAEIERMSVMEGLHNA